MPTPKIITRINAKIGDAVLNIGTDKIADKIKTIANATSGKVLVCKIFFRLIGNSSNKKFSGQIKLQKILPKIIATSASGNAEIISGVQSVLLANVISKAVSGSVKSTPASSAEMYVPYQIKSVNHIGRSKIISAAI